MGIDTFELYILISGLWAVCMGFLLIGLGVGSILFDIEEKPNA